jgi:hypothetical protein
MLLVQLRCHGAALLLHACMLPAQLLKGSAALLQLRADRLQPLLQLLHSLLSLLLALLQQQLGTASLQ